MNSTPIEELIQTCLDTLKDLNFAKSTIKRHRRHLSQLKDYMMSKGQSMYDENVGEKYLFENRLSDKFYFCNFTRVVVVFRKNQITTSGGNLRGVPLLLLF